MSHYGSYEERKNISALLGATLTAVVADYDYIEFHVNDGRLGRMFHSQDCCESVTIEDIDGELSDLVGSPILQAEESTSAEGSSECYESCTWTFYKLATQKGHVVIRWFGSSNGYYSESVDFYLEDKKENK